MLLIMVFRLFSAYFNWQAGIIIEIPISLLRDRNDKDNKYLINKTKIIKVDIKITLFSLIRKLNWLIISIICIRILLIASTNCDKLNLWNSGNNDFYVKNSTDKRQFLNIYTERILYFCFVKIHKH